MTVLVVVLFSTAANIAAAAVVTWHYRTRGVLKLGTPGSTNTEALAHARVHYRALFADLLCEPAAAPPNRAGPDGTPHAAEPTR